MSKAGAVLVSIWAGLNGLLAVGILFSMVVLGRHAPALGLYLGAEGVERLPPDAVAVFDAVATFGNGCAVGLCALMVVLAWKGVAAGAGWALPALTAVSAFVVACGVASDGYLAHRNVAANFGSAALLGAGLVLCALGGRQRRRA